MSNEPPELVVNFHPIEKQASPPPPPNVAFLTIYPLQPPPTASCTRSSPRSTTSLSPRSTSPSPYSAGLDNLDLSPQPERDIDLESPSANPPPNQLDSDPFPHTTVLIGRLLGAILGDVNEYMIKSFASVFRRVCDDHARKPKLPVSEKKVVLEVMAQATRVVKDFLRHDDGIKICISSALDQLDTDGVVWGFTNRHRDREDEYGLFVPALNWALCLSYEMLCISKDSAVIPKREQSGSLIAVSFMHESVHAVIRQGLKDVLDAHEFLTPELNAGVRGESGWEWEHLVFRGILLARWKAADIRKDSRFELIEDVWLQGSSFANNYSRVRPIPPASFHKFHKAIMKGKLDAITIITCFPRDDSSWLPYTTVVDGDRCLLRGPPSEAKLQPPLIYGLPIIPHCGLALERLTDEERTSMIHARRPPQNEFAE
ncbi:hypothetical protein B0H17DRAFT_1053247 [Mycena rosella]|uniref:Uncharacterized protein n=1 Tax=Mycena rosella TaxID=1033263 RepID=A0AAD7DR62_MYCRO|nr:hypothetical protein B0H17DRAFT_1053247 [Mycena rosella]